MYDQRSTDSGPTHLLESGSNCEHMQQLSFQTRFFLLPPSQVLFCQTMQVLTSLVVLLAVRSHHDQFSYPHEQPITRGLFCVVKPDHLNILPNLFLVSCIALSSLNPSRTSLCLIFSF